MSEYWIGPFLLALRKSGNVSVAAKAAGVSTAKVNALRAKDADFAASWDDAMDEAVDRLEAEAWHRAIHGVEEPVIYQGQPTFVFERNPDGSIKCDDDTGKPILVFNEDGTPKVLTVRKPSDRLLEFLLKGRRRNVFGDKTALVGGGPGDNPVRFMDETTRAARTAQLMAQAAARKRAAESTQGSDDEPATEDLA